MTDFASSVAQRLAERANLVLASKDIDEVVDGCTRTLRPHRLSVRGRQAKLDTRLHHMNLGHLSLNRLRYGGHVSVTPAAPEEDNFLISIPLRGTARFHYAKDTVEIGAGRGAVIGPYEKFCFDIDDAFDQIVVRLDRRRVESACAAMLGSDRTRPVHFELALHRMPQTWGNLLEAAANLATLDSALAHPRLHAQLEDMIVTSLLLSQPNSWSAAISGYGSAAPHAQVRRAMDYMRDHIDAPLRLGDIAKDCGMSLRSLQAGFQRDLGISPGRWLRAQRLERAHDTLLAAIPGSTTVTEVALRWGFPHLGEFAARYSARFGEKPSETLARLPH